MTGGRESPVDPHSITGPGRSGLVDCDASIAASDRGHPMGDANMAEFTEYAAGTPCWPDMQADDVGKAAAFYGGLFGWDAADLGEEAGHYTMFSLRGKAVAGAGPKMQPTTPNMWNTTIATDSADETAARVKAAGGTTYMEPMDVMTAGRMGVFADPTGAAFVAWQPKDHRGAELANEPNTFSWNELHTRDLDAAKGFYESVFGWTAQAFPEMGDYNVFNLGEKGIAGGMAMGPEMPADMPPHWLTYFEVGDTDASAAAAKALGGNVVVEPTDIPGVGRFAVVTDDQGAAFGIIRSQQPAAAS